MLISEVAVRAERKQILLCIVGGVLINMMQMRPITPTNRTAMIVFIKNLFFQSFGDRFSGHPVFLIVNVAVEKPFTEPNPQPLCCFFISCDQLAPLWSFDWNTTALLISGAKRPPLNPMRAVSGYILAPVSCR